MIQKFLQAKHWQIFLLIIGIPILAQVWMVFSIFSQASSGNVPGSDGIFNMMQWMMLLMIIPIGIFLAWFYSIAIGLDKFIPAELKLKTNRFKIFFFFPMVYMALFVFFISSSIGDPELFNPRWFALIVPLHLFTMFCMFHNLHFVAKTIKTAEQQRKVKFDDFAGEFFLLWFYPIGIWIVQPKINKIVQNKNENLLDEFGQNSF